MKQNPLIIPIVGVWRVKTMGAPSPYHMFTFHSDGTMLQSNPSVGNTDTSDTAGMGLWQERDGKVQARFEEYRIDLKDGVVTRGVVDFKIEVKAGGLRGSYEFNVYDADGSALVHGPRAGTLQGWRVQLPQ